jgi:hypothetical protein
MPPLASDRDEVHRQAEAQLCVRADVFVWTQTRPTCPQLLRCLAVPILSHSALQIIVISI